MLNKAEKSMQEMEIYTIFDRVAGANQLFVMPNETMAIRWFEDQVKMKPENGQRNYVAEHATDFVLCRLGYINNQTGEIRGEYAEIKEAYDIVKNNVETNNERREETKN